MEKQEQYKSTALGAESVRYADFVNTIQDRVRKISVEVNGSIVDTIPVSEALYNYTDGDPTKVTDEMIREEVERIGFKLD